MSWRDDLRDASFRGIGFKVDGHEADYGRRVAVHEYPFQDLPETEDLGARPNTFQLSAYVLGPDYFPARDALLGAVNKAGSGLLVHPYLGRVQVTVLEVRLSETSRQGGMARLDMRMIATSNVTAPTATPDTRIAVLTSSMAAQATADQALQDNWTVDTASAIDSVMAALDDAFAGIETAIGSAENVSTLAKQLVELPGQVAARIDGDIRKIGSIAGLRKFFSYNPRVPIGYSSGAQAINALGAHVRLTATFAAAELTAQTDYASYDDAIAGRDVVLDQIDAVAEDANADEYDALQNLRMQVARDIEIRAANLAVITSYTPGETLPALVIAQRLYGSIDIEAKAADIVARNSVVHPGFVPGGRPLEVLSE